MTMLIDDEWMEDGYVLYVPNQNEGKKVVYQPTILPAILAATFFVFFWNDDKSQIQ